MISESGAKISPSTVPSCLQAAYGHVPFESRSATSAVCGRLPYGLFASSTRALALLLDTLARDHDSRVQHAGCVHRAPRHLQRTRGSAARLRVALNSTHLWHKDSVIRCVSSCKVRAVRCQGVRPVAMPCEHAICAFARRAGARCGSCSQALGRPPALIGRYVSRAHGDRERTRPPPSVPVLRTGNRRVDNCAHRGYTRSRCASWASRQGSPSSACTRSAHDVLH